MDFQGLRDITRAEADRFWEKVRKADGCWLWTGAKSKSGYGSFRALGRTSYPHRLSFLMHHGAIPAGMEVCHRCDVRLCVNPAHLFAGTRADNMRDAALKGRTARGDRHGTRLHPEKYRGERCSSARLKTADVLAIRAAVAAGELQRSVADRFSIASSHVSNICARKGWRHIP